MIAKQVIDKVRSYTQKYGTETKAWPLAAQFQLLFETLPEVAKVGTVDALCVSTIYHIVASLSRIENSGIVDNGYKVKDRQWEDTTDSTYTCGRYMLEFTEYTRYKKTYVDTDWYLTVTQNDVISST